MTRSASKRLTHPRFVLFGPGLFALGLLLFTFVSCSDDTPRTGSIDLAASTKSAADRGSIGVSVIAPKTRDGSRSRPRTKWKIGRTLNPTSETPVKTR